MLIKNIEQRIIINKIVSLGTVAFAVIIVLAGFFFAYKMIQDSRKSIYILDNGVPVLAKQTDVLLNRPVEYKAQIELFHRLFFTLAPDDAYIKENIQKSLYLIDDSGKKEYTNLKEKGEHPYGFHFTEYGAKEVLLLRKADDYQKISSHHPETRYRRLF